MKIREVMTQGVANIRPGDSIQYAAAQMRSLDVGAMPVCQNDKIVGMITDRDIAVRAVASGGDPKSCCVGDVMSGGELVWCYDDDDVEEAARLMEKKQIRRLPILDRNNRLVGIVSLGDLATRTKNEKLSGEVLHQVSEPSHSQPQPPVV
jgi:CBS domain-containing protein